MRGHFNIIFLIFWIFVCICVIIHEKSLFAAVPDTMQGCITP